MVKSQFMFKREISEIHKQTPDSLKEFAPHKWRYNSLPNLHQTVKTEPSGPPIFQKSKRRYVDQIGFPEPSSQPQKEVSLTKDRVDLSKTSYKATFFVNKSFTDTLRQPMHTSSKYMFKATESASFKASFRNFTSFSKDSKAEAASDLTANAHFLKNLLELEKSIKKFNQDNKSGPPKQGEIKNALDILQIFSEKDSPTQQIFKNIIRILESAIFYDRSFLRVHQDLFRDAQTDKFRNLWEKTGDSSHNTEFSMSKIILCVFEELRVRTETFTELEKDYKKKVEILLGKCRKYEEESQKTADYYQSSDVGLAIQNQTAQIMELKKKVEDLEFDLDAQISKTDEMAAERKYLKERLETEISTQKSFTKKTMDLKQEISRKDYEISQLKIQLQKVKEYVDIFLTTTKEAFSLFELVEKATATLNAINGQLYNELQSLKYRSKNVSEEFTPRPNFNKISGGDKKFDALLDDPQRKIFKQKISTAEIFEKLIKKLNHASIEKEKSIVNHDEEHKAARRPSIRARNFGGLTVETKGEQPNSPGLRPSSFRKISAAGLPKDESTPLKKYSNFGEIALTKKSSEGSRRGSVISYEDTPGREETLPEQHFEDDMVETEHEKDVLEKAKAPIEKDPVEKFPLEKIAVEKDEIEKDAAEKHEVEKDTGEKVTLSELLENQKNNQAEIANMIGPCKRIFHQIEVSQKYLMEILVLH